MNLSDLAPGFLAHSRLMEPGLLWRSPGREPFRVYGLLKTGPDQWRRVPEDVAAATSDGVRELNFHTAGGRVRFQTDSDYVAVRAKPRNAGGMSHMPLTGSAGCDVYSDGVFAGTVIPDLVSGNPFEGLVRLRPGLKQITINLPLYNGVADMAVGLDGAAKLKEPEPYALEEPVVFYGSSITQGGCASRPGNSYEAILSRALDMNYINLGFSGCGRAEDAIVEYIAGLPMRAFVMDYDHNAPTPQYLELSHERMFRAIRRARPDLPILLLSRPDVDGPFTDAPARRAIVERTYRNAADAGDAHVYFLGGEALFEGENRADCSVDGTHPNDLGFFRMARAIRPTLERMLAE